ncbi:MAG TPA: hypothetical protein VKX17_17950 [Planctomycetota bacterium]|nr:hypothetical protein [Planctomycetota bacterium]
MATFDEQWCIALMKRVGPSRFAEKNGRKCMSFGEEAADQVYATIADPDENEPEGLYVRFWPGHTVSQARQFYAGVDIGRLSGLDEIGWEVQSNFHLSDAFGRATVNEWKTNRLRDYLAFWQLNTPLIAQHRKKKNDYPLISGTLPNWLPAPQMLEYDEKFIQMRTLMNVCPGIYMHFYWDKNNVEALEKTNNLVNDVRDRIIQAFETWREPGPRPW